MLAASSEPDGEDGRERRVPISRFGEIEWSVDGAGYDRVLSIDGFNADNRTQRFSRITAPQNKIITQLLALYTTA